MRSDTNREGMNRTGIRKLMAQASKTGLAERPRGVLVWVAPGPLVAQL